MLLIKANLRNIKIILDFRQRKFSVRLVTLSNENLIKNILLVIFRKGDESAQPIKQPIGDID